jgi:hypothetical protein
MLYWYRRKVLAFSLPLACAYLFNLAGDSTCKHSSYLTLTYKTDENDILTDENVPAKEHKFNLIGSSALTYTAINKFLGVDWDELAKTHSLRSESIVTFMKMQEDGTNYLLHGEITQFPQIPEGVLK